jgi:hypothetical protein
MTQKKQGKQEKKSMLSQVVHVLRSSEDEAKTAASPLPNLEHKNLPSEEDSKPGKGQFPEAAEEQEELVGLCIKVPKSMRHKWKVGAAREGITVTQAIMEALNQRFQ